MRPSPYECGLDPQIQSSCGPNSSDRATTGLISSASGTAPTMNATAPRQTAPRQRLSFARLRNRDHALLAVDRHRGVECCGAAAEVLQEPACVRALHESRLEQLRIIG